MTPLGGGERGTGMVALAVVDDAELIPGEGIAVVAHHRGLQNLLGLLELVAVLGRDQSVAEEGRDARFPGRDLARLAQRAQRLRRLAGMSEEPRRGKKGCRRGR